MASETENPDLFFGIRGGGSNFGVCTEFVLRLHHQRARVFAGLALYTPDVMDGGLPAITDEWWTRGPSEKEGMIHAFTQSPDGKVSYFQQHFMTHASPDVDSRSSLFSSFIMVQRRKAERTTRHFLTSVCRTGFLPKRNNPTSPCLEPSRDKTGEIPYEELNGMMVGLDYHQPHDLGLNVT